MRQADELLSFLEPVEYALSAEVACTISRMLMLERLPGNPIGIAYRRVDDRAIALLARLPPFCRVIGLRAGHEQAIEPLVACSGASPFSNSQRNMEREGMRVQFMRSLWTPI